MHLAGGSWCSPPANAARGGDTESHQRGASSVGGRDARDRVALVSVTQPPLMTGGVAAVRYNAECGSIDAGNNAGDDDKASELHCVLLLPKWCVRLQRTWTLTPCPLFERYPVLILHPLSFPRFHCAQTLRLTPHAGAGRDHLLPAHDCANTDHDGNPHRKPNVLADAGFLVLALRVAGVATDNTFHRGERRPQPPAATTTSRLITPPPSVLRRCAQFPTAQPAKGPTTPAP